MYKEQFVGRMAMLKCEYHLRVCKRVGVIAFQFIYVTLNRISL